MDDLDEDDADDDELLLDLWCVDDGVDLLLLFKIPPPLLLPLLLLLLFGSPGMCGYFPEAWRLGVASLLDGLDGLLFGVAFDGLVLDVFLWLDFEDGVELDKLGSWK